MFNRNAKKKVFFLCFNAFQNGICEIEAFIQMATFKNKEKFLPVNTYGNSTPTLDPLCILKNQHGCYTK